MSTYYLMGSCCLSVYLFARSRRLLPRAVCARRSSATAPGPQAGCRDAFWLGGGTASDKNYTVAQTQLGRELAELASVTQRRWKTTQLLGLVCEVTCTRGLTHAIRGYGSAAAATRMIGCVKQQGRNFGRWGGRGAVGA